MAFDWQTIDPEWSWSEYAPRGEAPWNAERASHLLRRAGFAAGPDTVRRAAELSPKEVIDGLFADPPDDEPFERESRDLSGAVLATGDAKNLAPWWFHRMLHSPQPLREKATLFWHGHFATSADKVNDGQLMFEQNALLREHALGDFTAMVQGISRDPAMLIYLDSATNRKSHPNENYAREVMELFCLGEGNYTEQDVRQVARCFTGWEVRRKKFRFNAYQFDSGEKTILGETAAFTGEDAVRRILEEPASPRFIARKLVRFFVRDEPDAPDTLLEPLAEQLRNDNMRVGGALRRIFASRLFFSAHAAAQKVRSPVELLVGLLRALDGSANVRVLADASDQLGQAVFRPPSVKGWDGGRAWINSATLLGRANSVRRLLNDENTRFGRGGLVELARRFDQSEPSRFVRWLATLLLAVPLPSDVERQLVRLAERGEQETNFREVLYSMATLPEFQLA